MECETCNRGVHGRCAIESGYDWQHGNVWCYGHKDKPLGSVDKFIELKQKDQPTKKKRVKRKK